ncbi:MAG TPA: hypothetical protein VFX61_03030 [Micromonosporaceae bacterium]|nr:hypothetical protein [Micromonosporaceae bacterium]
MLFLVLTAAVLILTIPLGALTLVGKIGDKGNSPAFNPAVGSCVKESDGEAVPANCEEQGAYQVLSKVDKESECVKPYIEVTGSGGKKEFLCLGPPAAAAGDDPAKANESPEADTNG